MPDGAAHFRRIWQTIWQTLRDILRLQCNLRIIAQRDDRLELDRVERLVPIKVRMR
jgi:hypothetical protein